ncbi:divalent-cation tolerance protein CutA [Streptomyces antimycoticus]|uniref:divalent-cation tolerance protein CutA n=1 Tax=Streptomyces antimycoticus TaxID=68175 RepID=UPI0032EFB0C3
MTDFLQVATATESREEAEKLAGPVVTARLAAGARIVGPVVSVFWHQGEFGTGEERQLLFKTRADRYADLRSHLPMVTRSADRGARALPGRAPAGWSGAGGLVKYQGSGWSLPPAGSP